MPRPIPWDPPEPVACRTWKAARMLGVSDGTLLLLPGEARLLAAQLDHETDDSHTASATAVIRSQP